jgi:hypothetical protein
MRYVQGVASLVAIAWRRPALAPQLALCFTSAMLVARLRPPGQRLDARQQEGRHALPVMPCSPASLQRLRVMAVDLLARHRRRFGHRRAQHDAAGQAQVPLGADEARLRGRRRRAEVGAEAAVARVEGGEVVLAAG